jgi:hypothetical protein
MKIRHSVLLFGLLIVLLAACSNETTLTFFNKTECGTATISITNADTGNLQTYSLDEGKRLEIAIDHGINYRYEITYTGRPDSDLNCESKSGTVMVPKRGQNSSFTLIGVTPTPEG